MGQLTTLLIFCFLTTNIFGHAHFKSHSSRRHSSNRENTNGTKTCLNSKSQLIFKYNSTSKFEYVYNRTGKAGLVSDTKSTIVVVFNNQTRLVIAIDYKTQIGVCFRNNTLNNWEEYFSRLTNLKTVVEDGRKAGETFNATSIPANVSEEVKPILKSLSPDYSNISDVVSDARRSSDALRRYSDILRNVRSGIYGNFHSLTNRLEGFDSFIRDLSSRINLNGTNVDLGKILNSQTGADVLGAFFKQLGSNHSLEEILGQASHSQGRLCSLISSLGGGANPADIPFRTFAQIFQIGSTPMSTFISAMIEMFTAGPRMWARFLSAAQNLAQTMTRTCGGVPPEYQNFIQSLVNRTGSINGFNASQLSDIFQNRDPRSNIDSLVHLLSLFSSRIPMQNSIITLLGQLVSLYQNQQNSTLRRLVPNFDASGQNSDNDVVGQFMKLFQTGAGSFFGIPLSMFQYFIISISSAMARYSNMSFIGIFQSPESFQLLQQAVQCGPGHLLASNPLNNFQNTIENAVGNIANNNKSSSSESPNPLSGLESALENVVSNRTDDNSNKTASSSPVEDLARSALFRNLKKSQEKKARNGNPNAIVKAAEDLAGGLGSGFVKNTITRLSHREKKSHSHNERHHSKGKEKKHVAQQI